MQYSRSLKYDTDKRIRLGLDLLTWIFRILVGATFIFSGFVKAVDPWGTLYKFEEYSAAIGIPVLHSLLLTGVFILCALEFIIGICIITGCYRRSSPVASLLFMCVMLPLTLWIAISDPVKDCGCFGDFLIISNWQTFWKNVLLTLMSIWLIRFNKDEHALITPALQWIQIVCSIVFIAIIMMTGYFKQPLLDFRPYPTGEVIYNDEESEDEDSNYVFVYEKGGIEKEFSIDDELPSEEDGWTFVNRKELSKPQSRIQNNKTFRIWNREGDKDETDEIFGHGGKQILLLIPQLESVSPATTWKINSMYDLSFNSGIDMIAVVSGSTDQINEWEDMSMPLYDIYTSDDTAIKEVARGNPAVVYIENDTIIWKSTLGALDIDDISHDNKPEVESLNSDSKKILKNIVYIYLICLATLITMSIFPIFFKLYK